MSPEFASSEEEFRTETSQKYEMFRNSVGGSVSFNDTLTPALYEDDPDRLCFYIGTVLEVGEDKDQPWALIEIEAHKIQLTSMQSVAPGFKEFFNSMFGDISLFNAAMQESQQFAQAHPATDIMLDLPLPTEPVKFLIKDIESPLFVMENRENP